MYEWIEDNYGEDAGEEGSDTWKEAVRSYEAHCEEEQARELNWQEGLAWIISSESKTTFDSQLKSVEKLLELDTDEETRFSLLVMLHGHVVAAVEAYLAATFIRKVTRSEELTKKLVETDPTFAKMKFTLKTIYEEHKTLKIRVASYLRDLIFHKLEKVMPMYKDVLGHDFGDISWLFRAV